MKSKRERIIETGKKLFLENGVQNTSMEQIAEAVPVSKMTIYNYFQSKEGLLKHIVNELMSEWLDKFRRLVEGAKDPLDALVTLSRYWEKEQYPEVFMKDLLEHYPALANRMLAFTRERFVPEMEQLIFRGQQTGQLRKDISPHVLMVFLMGLKEVFARPEMFSALGDAHTAGEQMMSIVCYGIVAPDWRERAGGAGGRGTT